MTCPTCGGTGSYEGNDSIGLGYTYQCFDCDAAAIRAAERPPRYDERNEIADLRRLVHDLQLRVSALERREPVTWPTLPPPYTPPPWQQPIIVTC